jgi:hypothetical protein
MIKTIISLLVVGAVAYGGYYYWQTRDLAAPEVATPAPSEQVVADAKEETAKPKTFEDYLKTGSYKCTVTQDVGVAQTQGIVFIDNGKIRGDFDSTVQSVKVNTSLIAKEGYVYTWTSLAPIGFKTALVKGVAATSSASTSGTYGIDTKKIGSYDCVSWIVDLSKFVLPTSVTFKDSIAK